MAFKVAKCPNCGGDLQVPDEKNTVKCMYCGSDIIAREAIKAAAAGVNIENLLSLAKAAFEAKNYQEAFDYYTKVLEVDAHNYEAWLSKGCSAGWLSTLSNLRMPEMITAFGKAIEYAPMDKKDEIKILGCDQMQKILLAYFNVSTANYVERTYALEAWRCAGDASKDHIQHCTEIISAFELAHKLLPDDKVIFENIIFMCNTALNAENVMSHFILYDQYSTILKMKRDIYVGKMKEIDPSYVDTFPQLKKAQEPVLKTPDPPRVNEKKSNCFIATATMGDANHPIVVLLREFRDLWLLKKKYGKIFIKFYYKIGPYPAMIINKYPYLKRISYMMIVRPVAYVADLLLKINIRNV